MSTESSPCHSKEPDLEEAGKRISGYVGSRATEDEMGAVKPIENSPEMLSRSIHIRERQERAGMRYSGKVLRHRTCRVPSCHADLSTGKKFNVRYRICEEHRTCQEVLVDGQDQRFCQMCARFHTLDNFDGSKMNCRNKLQEHNERRRSERSMKIKLGSQESNTISEENEQAQFSLATDVAKTLAEQNQLEIIAHNRGKNSKHKQVGAHDDILSRSEAALDSTNTEMAGERPDWKHVSSNIDESKRSTSAFKTRMPAKMQYTDSELVDMPAPNPQSAIGLGTAPSGNAHLDNSRCVELFQKMQVPKQDIRGSVTSVHQQITREEARRRCDEASLVKASEGMSFQRLSIKLFGCEPHELIREVRAELETLLQKCPGEVEKCARPGCAHLLFDICTPKPWSMASSLSLLERVFCLARRYVVVDTMSLMSIGDYHWKAYLKDNDTPQLVLHPIVTKAPVLERIRPACVTSHIETEVRLEAETWREKNEYVNAYCRQFGLDILCEMDASKCKNIGTLSIPVPLDIGRAEIEIEDTQTGLLSHSLPILVVPNDKIGREIANEMLGQESSLITANFLRQAGYVLQSSAEYNAGACANPNEKSPIFFESALLVAKIARSNGWCSLAALMMSFCEI